MSYETHIPYEKEKLTKIAFVAEETLEEVRDRICRERIKTAKDNNIPQPIVAYAIEGILDFYNEIK